jgi:Putative abortive phage resistance protein AbiGi, antitoxin
MDTPYTSDQLFHFVGYNKPNDDAENFNTLCKVLSDCCVSHKPHGNLPGTIRYTIDIEKSLLNEKLIVPTVTCFADIPPDSLGNHVRKYGRFGLGFRRDYLIFHGARPVTYIPLQASDWRGIYGSSMIRDIEAVYKGFVALYEKRPANTEKPISRKHGVIPTTEEETLMGLKSMIEKDFLAFLKPFNSELSPSDPENYYMEREWRKFANLRFTFDDVLRIYVARGYKALLAQVFPDLAAPVLEI